MENTHHLRSRKNTLVNKGIAQSTKKSQSSVPSPIFSNNASKREISVKRTVSKTLTTATKTASGLRTSLSSSSNLTNNTSRVSDVCKRPTANRLSAANNSSAPTTSITPSTHSAIKVLSEKISHFESKIDEIVGLYDQLKDENQRLQYVIAELIDLQSKFTDSEECRNQLKSENESLRLGIVELKSEIAQLSSIVLRKETEAENDSLDQLKSDISTLSKEFQQLKANKSSVDNNLNADQELLNCNIVIRGAEVTANTSESELRTVYSGLRNHLGGADVAEFEPVSITVINTNSAKNNTSLKPIRVQFKSVDAKRKFLQVRRVKKTISQIDIGIKGSVSRPILVTEELTRSNQELFFKARSLRNNGNYKFVWTCNGQVLVRFKQSSKVIRITDSEHVSQLQAGLHLEPSPDYGRHHLGASIQSTSDNTQI